MPWEDPSQGSGWAQSGAPAPQCGVPRGGGCGCLAPWAWGLAGLHRGGPAPGRGACRAQIGGGSGSRLWDGRGVGAAWGPPRPPVGPAAAGAVRGADGGVRGGRALPARSPTHAAHVCSHGTGGYPLLIRPVLSIRARRRNPPLRAPHPRRGGRWRGRGSSLPPPSPGQLSLSERLD